VCRWLAGNADGAEECREGGACDVRRCDGDTRSGIPRGGIAPLSATAAVGGAVVQPTGDASTFVPVQGLTEA
jgi:hypothetical protein